MTVTGTQLVIVARCANELGIYLANNTVNHREALISSYTQLSFGLHQGVMYRTESVSYAQGASTDQSQAGLGSYEKSMLVQ